MAGKERITQGSSSALSHTTGLGNPFPAMASGTVHGQQTQISSPGYATVLWFLHVAGWTPCLGRHLPPLYIHAFDHVTCRALPPPQL